MVDDQTGPEETKRCLRCRGIFASPDFDCPSCGHAPARSGNILCFAPELADDNADFDPNTFKELADLETRHFWFVNRARLLTDLFQQYFPEARTFLEVGCGTGFVLSSIAGSCPDLEIHGSDMYVEGLEIAAGRLGRAATLYQMDIKAIPFQEAFDVVGAFDVLEHIDNDERALENIFNAIRPGGGAVFTVPQHMFLWSAWDEMNMHKRRYAPGELALKATRAGFEVIYTTSFTTLLLPAVMVKRFLEKGKKTISPKDEQKITPLLNTIFSCVMALERRLLRIGVRFPVGSSCCIVLRKPADSLGT